MADMKSEELSDRLVVAAEEQDVLYVLHWLNEMKRMNCLAEAINNKHSWKGYSALESIINSPFTQLRRLILEILLLKGADIVSEDMLEVAMEKNNVEVVEILLAWENSGQNTAAAYLLSLPLEEVADWIDLNEFLPPNPEVLTGEGPLPLPPFPNVIVSAHLPQSFSSVPTTPSTSVTFAKEMLLETNANDTGTLNAEIDTTVEQDVPMPPAGDISTTPSSSSPPVSSQFRIEMSKDPRPCRRDSSTSLPSTELTSPSPALTLSSSPSLPTLPSVPRARLHIGRIPLNTHPLVIQKLFSDIGVECFVPRCWNKVVHGYTFTDVPLNTVDHCIRSLNCLDLDGCTITCSLASGQSIPQAIPARPPIPTRPPLPTTTALLILNLPLLETNESRVLLSNFSNYDIFPYPLRDQCVAFVRQVSEEEADRIVIMWNRCIVNGRNIRVVHAGRGLFAREAVEHYFRKQDELDRPLEYGEKRRRIG